MFEVLISNSDHIPALIFPHTQNQHGNLHQVPGKGSADADRVKGCWKILYQTTVFWTKPYKQKSSFLAVNNNFVFTSPLKPGHRTAKIATSLIKICGARLSKRPRKFSTASKIN